MDCVAGKGYQLGLQVLGVVVLAAWTCTLSGALFWLLNKVSNRTTTLASHTYHVAVRLTLDRMHVTVGRWAAVIGRAPGRLALASYQGGRGQKH